MKRATLTLLLAGLLLAGCGGGGNKMVWCAAPGEVVDAQFKADYPDLYISKAACDAANS